MYKFIKLVLRKIYSAKATFSKRLYFIVLTEKVFLNKKNSDVHPTTVFKAGDNSKIYFEGKNKVGRYCEFTTMANNQIKLGFGTTIQDRNIIIGDVEFGSYCLTAPNVYISSGKHYFDLKPYLYIKDQDILVKEDAYLISKHSRKVKIDDDVWIGINSVILAGVQVGKGSIIGSNSVVTRNVPPYYIVGGQPARIIGERLSFVPKSEISYLNETDWPHFYSGIVYREREKNKKLDGFQCKRSFVIHLDYVGNKIVLLLKNMHFKKIEIRYNKQMQVIEPISAFVEISFSIAANYYHFFEIVCDKNVEDDFFLILKKVKSI